VHNNSIDKEGVNAIAEALKVNKKLRELHLNGGAISLEEVIKALKCNKSLVHLNLTGNNLTKDNLKLLGESLRFNTILKGIGLSDRNLAYYDQNQTQLLSMSLFSEGLKGNKALAYLNLSYRNLNEEEMQSLPNVPTIRYLELSAIKMGDKGAEVIG
jgi:Ran GTPase-activating protein (RanGAP) involved in mRNA processing and transport